jgi:hypothetical protein
LGPVTKKLSSPLLKLSMASFSKTGFLKKCSHLETIKTNKTGSDQFQYFNILFFVTCGNAGHPMLQPDVCPKLSINELLKNMQVYHQHLLSLNLCHNFCRTITKFINIFFCYMRHPRASHVLTWCLCQTIHPRTVHKHASVPPVSFSSIKFVSQFFSCHIKVLHFQFCIGK